MFGVIGSGFGLYGHLPAIAQSGPEPVLLPERYLSTFKKRSELAAFEKQVRWVKDEQALLQEADSITISTWPQGQQVLINDCLIQAHIKYLVLEKPIAVSPALSKDLMEALMRSGKTFRINYTFLDVPWYHKLNALAGSSNVKSIHVSWNFMAHHYKHNLSTWKRINTLGGGAIRFYGIHFIAVLCALNFNKVSASVTDCFDNEDCFKWAATFSNASHTPFTVSVDSHAQSQEFTIRVLYTGKEQTDEEMTISMQDPFSDAPPSSLSLDPRVEGLKGMYASLNDEMQNASLYNTYSAVNTLWADIEILNKQRTVQKTIS